MGLLDGILPLNDRGDRSAAAALADTTVLCLVRAGIGDDHTHNTASGRTRLALEGFLARDTLYDGAQTSLLLVAVAAQTVSAFLSSHDPATTTTTATATTPIQSRTL